MCRSRDATSFGAGAPSWSFKGGPGAAASSRPPTPPSPRPQGSTSASRRCPCCCAGGPPGVGRRLPTLSAASALDADLHTATAHGEPLRVATGQAGEGGPLQPLAMFRLAVFHLTPNEEDDHLEHSSSPSCSGSATINVAPARSVRPPCSRLTFRASRSLPAKRSSCAPPPSSDPRAWRSARPAASVRASMGAKPQGNQPSARRTTTWATAIGTSTSPATSAR